MVKYYFSNFRRKYLNKAYLIENKDKLIKVAAIICVVILGSFIFIGKVTGSKDGHFFSNSQEKPEDTNSIHLVQALGSEEEKNSKKLEINKDGLSNKLDEGAESANEVTATVVIDVSGAVNKPGIVIINQGSRVYEAIEMAGGLSNDANINILNRAAFVEDGTKLYIPRLGETQDTALNQYLNSEYYSSTSGSGDKASGEAIPKKININTANSIELQLIKGVGPSTAERIIEYRKTKGPFKKIENIMDVKGIGPKTFEALKDRITV